MISKYMPSTAFDQSISVGADGSSGSLGVVTGSICVPSASILIRCTPSVSGGVSITISCGLAPSTIASTSEAESTSFGTHFVALACIAMLTSVFRSVMLGPCATANTREYTIARIRTSVRPMEMNTLLTILLAFTRFLFFTFILI